MHTQPHYIPTRTILIQPGECQIASEPNCRFVSREIRSSVVVAVLHPKLSLGGLARYRFPHEAEPSLLSLLSLIRERGKPDHEIFLYAAGGASLPEGTDARACGKANALALKRVLWRERLWLSGEDLGGEFIRTIFLEPQTGRIIVRSETQLLAVETQPLRHAI
jgi:chemotaxis receptor (MCP) glutamine deamidase CheD